MVITGIEKQIKNPDRCSVFIDNEFAFGISYVDLLFFKLKENEELSKERFDYIFNNVIFEKAKNKALKTLGYSQKTEKQLREKLSTDFSEEIIQKVIDFLKKYSYINDEIYANAFFKDKIKINGYGIYKISYELKKRGVSNEIIENIINNEYIQESEFKRAREIFTKKANSKGITPSSPFKEKQKLSDFMARRGYSYSIIRELFSELTD